MGSDGPKLSRLLITADAVGGVWQYSVDLARVLAQNGIEILLATLGPQPSEEQLYPLRDSRNVTLVHGDFALEWTSDPWRNVEHSTEWLLDQERRFEPDLIHLNGYSQAAADWRAPVICVAHSCVYSWWQAVHGCAPPAGWSEYRTRVTRGLEAADAIVAPSRFMAESICLYYGASREKIEVVHNFSSAPTSTTSCKETFLFAAGRLWDKAKNIGLLNRMAGELAWPLCVAGEGEADRQASINFLGRLSHEGVLKRMARAGIFIHPALYEPFGLAVLEAAQARCCLVLADIPSLRELWDGVALFVDPTDQRSWVRELNRMIGDSVERERLADQAFSQAKLYSRDLAIAAYERVYASALRKNSLHGVAA